MITVPLPCPKCQTKIAIELEQAPRLVNHAGVSMAVVEHTRHVVCATCLLTLQVCLAQIEQMMFTLVPVPPAKEKSLIVPPGTMLS